MTWGWSGTQQTAAVNNIQTTELFTSAIAFNPGETGQFEVDLDWGTSTGDLAIRIQQTTAETPGAGDWTEEIWKVAALTKTEWDGKVYPVPSLGRDLYKIRFGFVRDASDGDGVDATLRYRLDGGPS